MRFGYVDFIPSSAQVKTRRQSFYAQLAEDYKAEELYFMNYGFIPDNESDDRLTLDPSEERYRCQMQLYDQLAREVGLEGKDVLEVGCGRGGGAAYCTKYLRPRTYTGLDMTHGAVLHSTRGNAYGNLRFVVGDAENLPFPEAAFDVVINVESCHCYDPIEKFLTGVHRVLVRGGHLLLTDFRNLVGVDHLRRALVSCGMTLLKEKDISKNVFAAIKKESAGRMQAIVRLTPEHEWPLFREFGAVRGSYLYENLENGGAKYLSYVLQKQ